MAIRAYIYGHDLTKDLIAFNNKLTAAKRIVEENNGDYKNFSEAALKERMKTIGGGFESYLSESKTLAPVCSKYLVYQGSNSKQDTMSNFFASVVVNKTNS